MWEHAGLICFYPPCSPLRCPDQASPLYNPTGRPVCTMRWHCTDHDRSFRSAISSGAPANVPSVSACLLCRPSSGGHVSLLAFAAAELANTISQPTLLMVTNAGTLYPHCYSLITSALILRHGTAFSFTVDSLIQVSFIMVFSLNSTLRLALLRSLASPVRVAHILFNNRPARPPGLQRDISGMQLCLLKSLNK